jgi:hypothetical protein
MPGHGSDHPSPFWTPPSCAASAKTVTSEPPGTYQNFLKGRYQNFRNPQTSGLAFDLRIARSPQHAQSSL